MISLHLLQARYWDSSRAFVSARAIIMRKCGNMRHLLLRALPYRTTYPLHAAALTKSVCAIAAIESAVYNTPDRRALLLLEARAARAYWQSIALLIRSPAHWKRTYPHARDPWNQSFNIGYAILTKRISEILAAHHLSTEIGILHSPKKNHDALTYDMEELFRVPIVDMTVVRTYARTKHPPEPSRIAFMITKRLKERWYFKGAWRSLETLIDITAANYVSALIHHTPYLPFVLPWGHPTKKPFIVMNGLGKKSERVSR